MNVFFSGDYKAQFIILEGTANKKRPLLISKDDK